jgi:hypothetical protein
MTNQEPKQIKCYCGHTTMCDCGEEPKQETLEEAAEYYAHNYFDMHETNNYKALKQGFIKGAKWQQERSYSEEDVIAFAQWMYDYKGDINKVEELLKQFKKK